MSRASHNDSAESDRNYFFVVGCDGCPRGVTLFSPEEIDVSTCMNQLLSSGVPGQVIVQDTTGEGGQVPLRGLQTVNARCQRGSCPFDTDLLAVRKAIRAYMEAAGVPVVQVPRITHE